MWQVTWESDSRRPRHPIPVVAVKPWPGACAQGSTALRASFMPHEAVKTQHWNSFDLHNRGIDELVDEELENLHGQRDHGDQPLRHDRKRRRARPVK